MGQAMRKLSRLLAYSANVPAGIVLVLLLLDPDRPLAPIFALLAVSVGMVVAASLLGRGR